MNLSLLVPVLIIIVVISPYLVGGAKILVLNPLGVKSHLGFYGGAAEALAQGGHQVTLVSLYKYKEVPNLRQVILPGPFYDDIYASVFSDGPSSVLRKFFFRASDLCSESLELAMEVNVHKEKYDIVIMSAALCYCYLVIIHEQKIPYILAYPSTIFGPGHHLGGNINFPSIVPDKMFGTVYPLSFGDRLKSVIQDAVASASFYHFSLQTMETKCKELKQCPPDMPPFSEMMHNMSMTFVNEIRTLEEPPRPSMQNIIYAGGLHCREGEHLPKDLEDWVQSSGDAGFVFFSLGSAMKPSYLTESYRKILIHAFGRLNQKVLFKWDGDPMDDLPPNVRLQKWLPQQDLLAHPKIKLFITHGGLNSLMEATYHGVPLIGIPIFLDQNGNLNEAESQGWAKTLHWDDLDEQKLVDLIQEVIHNDKMKETMKRRSAIMRDERRPPKEEITYWTEYVLRHNGAPHLKSVIRDMPWYILYNADVWATLLFIGTSVVSLTFLFLYCLLRWCCCRKSKHVKKLKKK